MVHQSLYSHKPLYWLQIQCKLLYVEILLWKATPLQSFSSRISQNANWGLLKILWKQLGTRRAMCDWRYSYRWYSLPCAAKNILLCFLKTVFYQWCGLGFSFYTVTSFFKLLLQIVSETMCVFITLELLEWQLNAVGKGWGGLFMMTCRATKDTKMMIVTNWDKGMLPPPGYSSWLEIWVAALAKAYLTKDSTRSAAGIKYKAGLCRSVLWNRGEWVEVAL